MTDEEWVVSNNPAHLLSGLGPRVSPRKLRLFAVACCHRIEGLLKDPRSKEAVRAAEEMAEGKRAPDAFGRAWLARNERLTQKERYAAEAAACAIDGTLALGGPPPSEASGVWFSAKKAAENAMSAAACAPDAPAGDPLAERSLPAEAAEKRAQCALLRDIFAGLRPHPPLDPAIRAWHGGMVTQLARVIYDTQDFEALPILADALEDAGCTDAALLAHCRGPGPHVRGCWAVDLVLGKE